jgi:NADH-quinone oxidoreductase subunit N
MMFGTTAIIGTTVSSAALTALPPDVLAADGLAAEIQLPGLDYAAMAPMLILFGAACIGVLVEAFVPRSARHASQFLLSLAALVLALGAVVRVAGSGRREFTADVALAIDGPALFLQGTLAVLGLVALLLLGERALETGGPFVAQAAITIGSEADRRQATRETGATEVFPLTLFALGGMMMFVAANDLLTMFIALEVFSLPLYLLCALARRRRLISQEASLKYFLLGAFASAFFIFGMALLYGFAGTVSFGGIHDARLAATTSQVLFFAGLALVSVGLLFKIAAVPFHVWTPDVYQGAPTSVTALMAACTKVAAFGGLLRVLYVALDRAQWEVQLILGTIAVITMLVGAVLAVTQTDIKRLLAYSSIANAGYLLVGTLAFTRDGLSSSMFYLVAYGFTVIAAFAVVTLVRDDDGEATHLSRWAGLGRRSPLFAALFTFLMLAFAGIPLTSGFTSKFAVFGAALGSNQTWLVIAGVVTSMVLAFPYLRVVVMMWLSEPAEQAPTVSIPGAFTSAALMAGVLVTLLLGVWPAPILDLANQASEFIR